MIVPAKDAYVSSSLINMGEYSPAEQQLLSSLIKPRDVVADIGANIGALAIPLSKENPSIDVYAFEPHPQIFSLLSANIATTKTHRVIPVNMAFGSTQTTCRVESNDISFNAGASKAIIDKEASIPMTTIDDFFHEVDLLKIDVEGAEGAVLYGAQETLDTQEPIVFYEADREGWKEAADLLAEAGYEQRWFVTTLYSPSNHKNLQQDIWNNACSFNILAWKPPIHNHVNSFAAQLPTLDKITEPGVCSNEYVITDLKRKTS